MTLLIWVALALPIDKIRPEIMEFPRIVDDYKNLIDRRIVPNIRIMGVMWDIA